jgi:hypothetical protein
VDKPAEYVDPFDAPAVLDARGTDVGGRDGHAKVDAAVRPAVL